MDKLILELHEELIAKEQKINELKEVIDLQKAQMVAYQERFRVLQDKINNAIEYINNHWDLATDKNVEFCILRDRVYQTLKGE